MVVCVCPVTSFYGGGHRVRSLRVSAQNVTMFPIPSSLLRTLARPKTSILMVWTTEAYQICLEYDGQHPFQLACILHGRSRAISYKRAIYSMKCLRCVHIDPIRRLNTVRKHAKLITPFLSHQLQLAEEYRRSCISICVRAFWLVSAHSADRYTHVLIYTNQTQVHI